MWPIAAHAAPREGPVRLVDVVKVDGVIDRPVADYLIGALHDAEQTGSTVVIQLTTPGSIDIDPVALAERMFDATVPVVVWVGPALDPHPCSLGPALRHCGPGWAARCAGRHWPQGTTSGG